MLLWYFYLLLGVNASGKVSHFAYDNGVQRIVVGKTLNRRQDSSQHILHQLTVFDPHILNYHFFAEVFVSKDSKNLHGSSLSGPGKLINPIHFPDKGYDREIHGGRYPSADALNVDYPDGDYWIHYNITSGIPSKQVAHLKKIRSVDHIPDPITIKLFQQGKQIDSNAVSPLFDVTITWTRFKNGGPDPNKVCPDLEFVEVGDCWGNSILHSGEPFSGDDTDLLTYLNTSYIIPKHLLKPKQTFQISVEQAKKVTSIKNNIPGLGTFATSTFLDFQTTGNGYEDHTSIDVCPQLPLLMDCGQTDRPANPNHPC